MTGTLGLFSLVDLFQLLTASSRTGRLLVEHPEGTARVYFDRGKVVHAEFGECRGVDAVYHLFGDERGSFEFGLGLPAPDTTIQTSTDNLLLEAIRRVDEYRRDNPVQDTQAVNQANPQPSYAPDAVPAAAKDDADDLTLADKESEVLRLANGGRNLSEIAQSAGLGLDEVRKIVARLSQVGALELQNKKPRVARLVTQLGKRLPRGTVGIDEQILANWERMLGEPTTRVACRRPDGKVDVYAAQGVSGAGPYLLLSKETLFAANLSVNTALLVKPANGLN